MAVLEHFREFYCHPKVRLISGLYNRTVRVVPKLKQRWEGGGGGIEGATLFYLHRSALWMAKKFVKVQICQGTCHL